MRTKRFLGSVLAMLCTIAVIGSGFALWVFQYKDVKNQADIGLSVEQAVNVGNITVADQFGINFDQTSKPDGWDLDDTSNGITINFVASDAVNKVASYDKDATDIEDNMEVKFTVAITISNALASYIDFDTTNETFNKTTDANVIYFTSNSAHEFDWGKVTITYKEDKEPTTIYGYRNFYDIVKASGISVVYTAEVVGK